MRGIAGIAGLLIVLGAGYFVYHSYLTQSGPGGATAHPQEQIDVIDIKILRDHRTAAAGRPALNRHGHARLCVQCGTGGRQSVHGDGHADRPQ